MDYDSLIKKYQEQLAKSIGHLEYSYKKVTKLHTNVGQLSEEELEAWEGFMARFSRSSDIFLTKYLRSIIKKEDPGFSGTMRDLLNKAAKLNLISDPQIWLGIRELRNTQAHEYTEEKLGILFAAVLKESVHILGLSKIL